MRALSVIALFTVSLAAVAALPRTDDRIIGGSVTSISNYPYAAVLLHASDLINYRQFCGGTIINNRSILSAAHCFINRAPNTWRIRIGSTYSLRGGVVHNVNLIFTHPDYNIVRYDSDVAVLRSASTFTFNKNVRPARIAGPNYNAGDNQEVWVIGWGVTMIAGSPSEQLRHVQVWTVNHETCKSRYNEVNMPVTDNMLCSGWLDVGGRDQCSGDSGGPVIHNDVIVGVSSWGLLCALARYPGVNTRVSSFTPWIQAHA